VKCVGVGVAVEVAVLAPPVGPAAGEAVKDLTGVALGTGDRVAVGVVHGIAVGIELRHTRLAEVLLYQDVNRDLRPALGNQNIIHREDQAAVGIANFRRSRRESDVCVRISSRSGESALYLHLAPSTSRGFLRFYATNLPRSCAADVPLIGENFSDFDHYILGLGGLSTTRCWGFSVFLSV